MHVIRGGDGDGVDGFLHLVKHLAEILSVARRGIFGRDCVVLVSTSQSATTLAPQRAELSVSLLLPPAPIAARLTLLLSFAAKHERARQAAPNAAVDVWEMNLRRVRSVFSLYSC